MSGVFERLLLRCGGEEEVSEHDGVEAKHVDL